MSNEAEQTLSVSVDVRVIDGRGPLSDWDDATKLCVHFNER